MNYIWAFITDGFITHPGYPLSIQIPHNIGAMWSFRKSYTDSDYTNVSFWHKWIAAYFCHGYGGTAVRDALLGRPISLIAHPEIMSNYVPWGLLLVNYSPNDFMWKMLQTPLHPVRLITIAGDACDSTTTLCSSYELALRLHPKAPQAPFVSAMALVLGGSAFRWLERRGRKPEQETEWASPSGGLQTGVVLTFMYHYLRGTYGIRFARLWTVMLNIIIKLVASEAPHIFGNPAWKKWNPAAWLYDRVYYALTIVKTTFRLGPSNIGCSELEKL
jgi:hypothetical protein